VRRFPTKEVASGQGATDTRPVGPRGKTGPVERPRPSGERESGPVGEGKGSGPWLGRKPVLGPIQEIKHFQLFYLEFKFLANFRNLYKEI
jgi:hypothetical protein